MILFFIPDVMGSKFSAGDQRATGVTIGHGHRLPYKGYCIDSYYIDSPSATLISHLRVIG